MSIKNIIIISFVFLSLSGVSTAELIDRIVAKVNGDIITFSELEEMVYSGVNKDDENTKEMKKIFNKEKKNTLNKIIEQKLMLQFAKQNKIEPSKDNVNGAIEEIKKNNNFSDEMFEVMLEREGLTMEKYRSSLKEQITLSQVVSSEVRSRIKVNENEVEKYYQKNRKKFLQPAEIKAHHIIIVINNKEDKVEAIKQKKKALRILKLAKSGRDFEQLAKTYSEGPSKDTGGDLGWVKKGSMISSFENAAFSLKRGEISDLVKTDYGYHIIKVEKRKEAKVRSLDNTRNEIQEILYKEKYEDRYNIWVAELKKNAFIEIYLKNKSYEKKYASLNNKKKRIHKRANKSGSNKKNGEKIKTKEKEKSKTNLKTANTKEKINISKFILNWEKARETKNRKRYFSFYSKNFKVNGMSRNKWEKVTEKENEKYKFIDIEIRGFQVYKKKDLYVAAFDQRFKSNIDDQIRLVRLYLAKDKDKFKIVQEKWLNSPDTREEFSQKPLLSSFTLPKTSSKLSRKKKQAHMIEPLGLL